MSIVSFDGSEFQSAIVVEAHGEKLVVDSRLVALDLDIEHRALMQTIKKHQGKIEQRFGTIAFQMSSSIMPNGSKNPKPEKFAWLTEDQAMFVMTLSRNTERVIDCKANLVTAFSNARKQVVTKSHPVLQPVTDETVKVHIQGIKYLTDNGDLKLAQLLKVQLGNRLLIEQQSMLQPAEMPQPYEGVVEVATRLGFNVPANYQSSLGTKVGEACRHLRVGHNERFSDTSGNKVPACMYPARHPEVEEAVRNYCVSKSFYHREINLLS